MEQTDTLLCAGTLPTTMLTPVQASQHACPQTPCPRHPWFSSPAGHCIIAAAHACALCDLGLAAQDAHVSGRGFGTGRMLCTRGATEQHTTRTSTKTVPPLPLSCPPACPAGSRRCRTQACRHFQHLRQQQQQGHRSSSSKSVGRPLSWRSKCAHGLWCVLAGSTCV